MQRLEGAGVRSISNVVDATNYMLHGFGQPMHAFDLGKLAAASVVVRRAKAGERLTTLDGVERTLNASMLVIADHDRAQAVAGVIGGQESEVDDLTTDLLLEVAVFDPQSVRATRRALGVSTDASYRFERAMDTHACSELAQYAASLIVSVAGGEVEGAPIMIGGPVATAPAVTLRVARVATVLGETVPADECVSLLRSVGFAVETGDAGRGMGTGVESGTSADSSLETHAETLRVTPPSWRSDVSLEVDLIEEIARLRGYDSFGSELRPFRVSTVPDAPVYTVTDRVTQALVAAGLYEVRPIPFVADAGERGVRVRNPLAENEAMLRSDVLSTLARRVEHNFAHMVRDVRMFEIGVAFTKGADKLPHERTLAAVVITGNRYPEHFTNAKPPQVDIWDAKYLAETIGEAAFGKGRMQLQPNAGGDGWDAMIGDAVIGLVRQIEVDAPVWASPVFGVEIDLGRALELDTTLASPRYKALPVTPASEFDLALLLPEELSAERVAGVIRTSAGDLLESLVPFDEFRGKGVEQGYRSVAWRLTLRHPERTLREKEIEGRRDKILRTLDQELGVKQRTS
jgi:phenylalanyl-tRNA synthetase beta chain